MSNEFKNWLIIIKKAEILNDLILLLRNIDANMKKISKQSQLHVKLNTSNFRTIKPPFKSYNSAFTQLFTTVEVVVISLLSSLTIGTHPGLMDVSSVIRRGAISQKEKNRHNSLGLYCYYGKPGHIAINHKNSALLATKKQIVNTFTSNSMALVLYKPLSMEEKETFLD